MDTADYTKSKFDSALSEVVYLDSLDFGHESEVHDVYVMDYPQSWVVTAEDDPDGFPSHLVGTAVPAGRYEVRQDDQGFVTVTHLGAQVATVSLVRTTQRPEPTTRASIAFMRLNRLASQARTAYWAMAQTLVSVHGEAAYLAARDAYDRLETLKVAAHGTYEHRLAAVREA